MSSNITTTTVDPTSYLGSSSNKEGPCYVRGWEDINHVLFQLANFFLLISYLAPPGIYGALFLRVTLTIGLLLLVLWAGLIICAMDVLVWNLVFAVINFGYGLLILWKLRPWIVFPPDIELVYRDLFIPLKVSKESFQQIYKRTRGMETLKPNEVYCTEGVSKVDKLSVVLSGRVSVSRKGKIIHIVEKHQFIDSPEWFGIGAKDRHQVTARALEPTKILVWDRFKLKQFIADDDYMKAVMDNILGKDVVKKLLYVTDHTGAADPGAETTPIKKSSKEHQVPGSQSKDHVPRSPSREHDVNAKNNV